jgi:hypothetical protein
LKSFIPLHDIAGGALLSFASALLGKCSSCAPIHHVFFHKYRARSAIRPRNSIYGKERISAMQLADTITSQIGASGVEVSVRKDHAYGWQPTIPAVPSDVIGFQRRADEIAHRLRVRFELRD